MRTVDEHVARADLDACFRAAADVERWPRILPHYRHVRFRRRDGFGRGRVEMAAWRDFGGPLRYPTWWVSEMWAEPEASRIRYRHIEGITRGMDVVWAFEPAAGATRISVIHAWGGPAWPLVGRIAADRVIGPSFISAIARRTLAGVAAEAERASGLAAQAEPSIGGGS